MFEGKKGEVFSSNSDFRKSLKSIIIVVITVTFLAIVYYIFLSYYISNLNITKNENLTNLENVNPNPSRSLETSLSQYYSLLDISISYKNASICDTDSRDFTAYCKIRYYSKMNDSSFCESNFEGLGKARAPMLRNNKLNYNSICWITISITQRVNYCDRIDNSEEKEVCLEILKQNNIK